MSKKQWFVLFFLFCIYLVVGALVFYFTQSTNGLAKDDEKESEFFEKFRNGDHAEICMELCHPPEKRWDFYHSLFFVITVVSTIGYGDLTPRTRFGRIFMIFYALFGIPINGILMVNLGDFFRKSFTKLYQRWKTAKMSYDTTRLSLISQIVLYLVPGFTIFIFLPAAIMCYMEEWDYDMAVYHCFVTLTTIGFGDLVAGTEADNNTVVYVIYQIFLVLWVMGGLGYVLMILGFISQGMRSKKMQEFEQVISQNLKKTPLRIRKELRSLLKELLVLKIKRVYKDDFSYTPVKLTRSRSCPDLRPHISSFIMEKKRTVSHCPTNSTMKKIQSDSDLERINKDLTFNKHVDEDFMQQKKLILKVVDALNKRDKRDICVVENETLTSVPAAKKLRRAVSDIQAPLYYNNASQPKSNRKFSVPPPSTTTSFSNKRPGTILVRLKNKFVPNKESKQSTEVKEDPTDNLLQSGENLYIRKGHYGRPSEEILEGTSIADFIRALTVITDPREILTDNVPKRRKIGIASLTPPKIRKQLDVNEKSRKTSLMMTDSSSSNNQLRQRRFSLGPIEENSSITDF